jgi:hypothetical protein
MASVEADTNLLFGILGLQVGLIEQADLFDGVQRWSQNRAGSLAQVLVDRGVLAIDDRATLENLVRRHVAKHGGNMERSLAAVSPPPAIVTGLLQLGEPELDATWSCLPTVWFTF